MGGIEEEVFMGGHGKGSVRMGRMDEFNEWFWVERIGDLFLCKKSIQHNSREAGEAGERAWQVSGIMQPGEGWKADPR